MKRLLSYLILFPWALWLGGLMTLFLSVQSLFARDRAVAMSANPILFDLFERYQLGLALVALAVAALLMVLVRSRLVLALLVLLALATVGAGASSAVVTPRIQELTRQQQTATPEFRRLHGQSMMIYTAEAVVLVAAGLLLPGVFVRSAPRAVESDQTGSGTAQG